MWCYYNAWKFGGKTPNRQKNFRKNNPAVDDLNRLFAYHNKCKPLALFLSCTLDVYEVVYWKHVWLIKVCGYRLLYVLQDIFLNSHSTNSRNPTHLWCSVEWLNNWTWWRHQMETFSALLALCAGNSPVTSEFPSQKSVTRSLWVFFDLRPNKRLSIQSKYHWFETLSRSLWHHCNGTVWTQWCQRSGTL